MISGGIGLNENCQNKLLTKQMGVVFVSAWQIAQLHQHKLHQSNGLEWVCVVQLPKQCMFWVSYLHLLTIQDTDLHKSLKVILSKSLADSVIN